MFLRQAIVAPTPFSALESASLSCPDKTDGFPNLSTSSLTRPTCDRQQSLKTFSSLTPIHRWLKVPLA